MKVLVTGAAGFIGFHTADYLARRGDDVVGIDNLSPYYDVNLKEARLSKLRAHANFQFVKGDLKDRSTVEAVFRDHRPQRVAHLAAQAGVRYSLTHPHAYGEANLTGFLNVLEACRHSKIEHLLFASSSSVYGANARLPFSVHDNVDHPVSLYAATKKANEVMAHAYAHLYRLPVTGLRFFTVYGPWGRPDMSPFIFTERIFKGEPIDVFNEGRHRRDFTYIDDVVEGVVRTLDLVPEPDPNWSADRPDPASSNAPYRLYNIGNHSPVALMDYIATIEKAVGKKARINLLPLQPGDVEATFADVSELKAATGFEPKTALAEGIAKFVAWYRDYYKL
jgi:UDP-glucuronate 4-epimerase